MPTEHELLASIVGSHADMVKAASAVGVTLRRDGSIASCWSRDADQSSVFRIASMTKSFTAAAVLGLRDEGVLTLDAPIADYAPELASIKGPGIAPSPISLRHLLSMSSGLATDDPWADRHLDATDDDMDRWVADGLQFACPTGTAFEYSNLGFGLIGRVVHRVTGSRLQDLVTERLLRPLGMLHTSWTIAGLATGANVTQGFHPHGDGLLPTQPLGDGVIAPMGGLWSNATDLGRWVAFLASAFGSSPIDGPLSPQSRREMQRVHTFYPFSRTVDAGGTVRTVSGGYGFGLNVTVDERLGRTIWHSGGVPGYGSHMRWWPDGGGVVLLANVTYAPMTAAGAALIERLALHEYVEPETTHPTATMVDLATALVRQFGEWSAAGGDNTRADHFADLFADNVELDRSWAHRRSDCVEKFGAVKPLLVRIETTSATSAGLVLDVGGETKRVDVQLSPLSPARVQWYRWV